MTDDTTLVPDDTPHAHGRRWQRRLPLVGGAAAILVVMAASAIALQPDPSTVALDVPPVAVAALQSSSLTAVRGNVAEIFGNTFVLQDASGRTLVDEGRAGVGTALVSKGESLTVVGRLDDGIFQASVLTHGDGKRVVIGPLMPPPGPLARIKERMGLWPQLDRAKLTGLVEQSGYTNVRVAGRGPRHLDVVAKGADGRDHELHVDMDGRIRDAQVGPGDGGPKDGGPKDGGPREGGPREAGPPAGGPDGAGPGAPPPVADTGTRGAPAPAPESGVREP